MTRNFLSSTSKLITEAIINAYEETHNYRSAWEDPLQAHHFATKEEVVDQGEDKSDAFYGIL